MTEDLSVGTLSVDTGPYAAALDRLLAQTDTLGAAAKASGDMQTRALAEAAKAATAYSDRLAGATMEQRAARDAVASASEALRGLTQQQKDLTAAASKKGIGAEEYARLQKLLEQNRVEIQKAKQAIQENAEAARQERAVVEAVREARRQETNATKEAAAAAKDVTNAVKQEAAAAKESTAATDGASKSTGLFSSLLGKAGAAFGGLFAVGKVVEVAEEIRQVTAEFEKYQITLTGAFDGDKGRAERAIVQVRNFANANGLEVTSLTDTYVKLVNRGIIPTTQQLRQLSDIAATSGKSTDQFVEALLDAQTGEFERLKEFGIKVKNNGDTIAFSFRGVKTEVKNTQDAISQYLFALGDAAGVQGQAAAQLKSLGGAAADSKNAFTELFDVIGERAKGIFGGLSNATAGAARALANYFKSTDRIALEQSAGGIDSYAQFVGAKFEQVAASARAQGGDVTAALKQASEDQTKFLDQKLAKARRDLANYYKSAQEASALGGGEVDAIDPAQVTRYQTAIKLYEGQREAAKRAYDTAVAGGKAEADQVGRIAALRAKIAAEEKARDAAPDTDTGNKERERLVKQLDADNKLLQELLGKVDKAAKAAADKLASALRALEQERATLQSLSAKAVIKDSDDQAARARLNFEEQLRQVEIVKQKLIERERAVRAAGGRGSNADGIIDGVQDQQLANLRVAALDKYYEELGKIEIAREQRLFDLRADSDAKEVEAVTRKYDRLLAAQHIGQAAEFAALDEAAGIALDKGRKRTQEEIAIEEARARELTALRATQEQRRIDQTKALATNTAQAVGQVYGAGTGVSVFEAKRAEAQALLNIEKKAAEDSLNNTLNKTGKEAEIERAALRAQLGRIAQQQKDLTFQETLSKFSIYKLILGENDNEQTRAALDKVASTVANALSEITAAEQQAAADRVSVSTQVINELTGQLAAQIQLNQEGSASNIKGLQDQIAAEKVARKQALADQREAAKEKVLIDTLTQASSITTAAAEVFATFAPIPFVGVPLGIAAATLLVGAFTASKVQAYQAAGKTGAGFFTGGPTGGTDIREERGVVHGKEFVFDHEKTAQYQRPLFDALHAGRPQDIDWSHPKLRALLPDYSLPGTLRAEKAEFMRVQHEHSFTPMLAEFNGLRAELTEIKHSNAKMAARWDVIPTADGHRLVDPATGSSHDIKLG